MNSIDLSGHFPMPPGATAPKFKVGDRVKTEWEIDDRFDLKLHGMIARVVGYITGAEYCCPSWDCPEWVYWVLVDESLYPEEILRTIEFGEPYLEVAS